MIKRAIGEVLKDSRRVASRTRSAIVRPEVQEPRRTGSGALGADEYGPDGFPALGERGNTGEADT